MIATNMVCSYISYTNHYRYYSYLLGQRYPLKRAVTLIGLVLTLIVAMINLINVSKFGPLKVELGSWPAIWYYLLLDTLGAMLIVTSIIITLLITIYSFQLPESIESVIIFIFQSSLC